MSVHMNRIVLAGAAAAAMIGCENRDNPPHSSTPSTTSSRVSPGPTGKTATDQSENAGDIRITADIRRAVMDDSSMSTAAQNCTVITDHGVVTLRGQVASEAEKEAVAAKAGAVAGVTRVDNRLEVKPR